MSSIEDAVALVVWYEQLPQHGTYKQDAEIAATLGWFKGGWQNRVGGEGDAGRVRKTRRYVDKHGVEARSPLNGYRFGTRRNGSGRGYSHLITPREASATEALDRAAREQVVRDIQSFNQHSAEVDRAAKHYLGLKDKYFAAGQIEHVLCCHDLARDLETLGYLRMATIESAMTLGILQEDEANG